MNHVVRNALRWAVLSVLGIGLAACPPVTSKTPLGTTAKSANDPALTGIWRGRIGDSKTFSYFTFLPQKDGTITGVIVTPPSAKDEGGWATFSLQTVALGPNHYMNGRETFDDGKPATGSIADNSFPVLYRINSDGAIVLYIIDENAAKNAIKSGKIMGTVGEGQFGDIMLTAPPGDLDAFMASPSGRALFVKPLVILRRVK